MLAFSDYYLLGTVGSKSIRKSLQIEFQDACSQITYAQMSAADDILAKSPILLSLLAGKIDKVSTSYEQQIEDMLDALDFQGSLRQQCSELLLVELIPATDKDLILEPESKLISL